MPARRHAQSPPGRHRTPPPAPDAGAESCLGDIDMALTMLERARVATGREARERSVGIARRAYHTIADIAEDLALDSEERARINGQLDALRKRLDEFE